MSLSRPVSLWLTPAAIIALGMAVLLFDPFGWKTAVAGRLFDAWQRHLPLAAHSKVVALDLPTLDEDTMAAVVRGLSQAGAGTLVLAAPPAPSPSPRQLIDKLPPGEDAARAALARLPEPGAMLVAAAYGHNLVLAAGPARPGAARTRFVFRGTSNPFGGVPRLRPGASAPPVLESAAAGVGAAAPIVDRDGVVRRMPIAVQAHGTLMPSLATETLRLLDKQRTITVATDERDPLTMLTGVGIGALLTPNALLPTQPDGTFWLRWGPVHHIAPALVETPAEPGAPARGPAENLAGSIVVIGPEGADFMTPLGPDSLAGVTAAALNTMLAQAAPVRPLWAGPVEALLLALLGAGLVLALHKGLRQAAAMTALALPLLLFCGWQAFVQGGLLLDVATPAILLVLALAGGALALAYEEHKVRIGLRLAVADSLPRASIEQIARHPSLLSREGETRTVTYLVCGVRGLADLAAGYREDPAGYTRLMQQVLTPLIDQALAHGGTIDRLTADGFAAFWNAPLDDADHALHACEAAADMSMKAARIAEQMALEEGGRPAATMPVQIGVGIATGPVIAGAFGGVGRMGYSVSGDAVGLAQRIQALSHLYGPSVIVADQTRQATDHAFAWLEVDTIATGAKDPPVTLFAMMGNSATRASPKFRALCVFHDHIFRAIRRQQWSMARDLIAQCRRLSGASQPMYDLHLSRIARYEKHPPGPDWDGAFRPAPEQGADQVWSGTAASP